MLGKKSVYPLTAENLQALLEYYLPQFEQGTLSNILPRLINVGATLKDLELSLNDIQPYLSELEHYYQHKLLRITLVYLTLNIFHDISWGISFHRNHKDAVSKMREVIGHDH